MRTRVLVVVVAVVALAAGCKKKKATASAASGSGAGTGSAGPAGSPGPAPAGKVTITAKPGGTRAKLDAAEIAKAAAGKNTPAAPAAPAEVKPEQDDQGDLSVVYAEGESDARALLKDAQVFETAVENLNASIKLPRNIEIHVDRCGEANAFYDPEKHSITLCDELVEDVAQSMAEGRTDDELGEAVVGATYFFFLHELGHALIDQLQLPAVGRQEDAVDQLAAIILISGGDEGEAMALNGAESFTASGQDDTPFWDEHSLNEQRFYNIICLIYGSNPEKYADLVKDGTLPEERAEQCPDEYQQVSASWDKLLEPYSKE